MPRLNPGDGAWCPYCSPQLRPSTSRPSPSDTAPSRRPSPRIPAPLSTLIRSTRSPPASDRLIGMVRHGDSTPRSSGLISQPSTASCRKTITAATATVRTLVITAREDLQIAGEARRLLSTP